jgi:DNA-binding MarR family transcriptional regulator
VTPVVQEADPALVAAVRSLARLARLLERSSGDLTLAQYRVLAAVAEGDERASRIADRLALGKPAISAAVESLNQRGLLVRNPAVDDQRAAALSITDDGRSALARAERSMCDELAAIAECRGDAQDLLSALTNLGGALDDHRAACRGQRR